MRRVLVATLVLVGCSSPQPKPAPRPDPSSVAGGPVVPQENLYDLRLPSLVDDAGRAITLDAQRGHPVVVSLFYASCPQACPALIAEMGEMDSRLEPSGKRAVRYLLVSMDPAHDDVAALAKVRADHHLDERWTLARASENDVRLLATVLGLRYRFRADGQIDHTTNLLLVAPDGALDARIDGLGQPKDELLRRISELKREPAGS